MNAKRDIRIRHALFVATLAVAAGVFSANSFGMPTPLSVDALGRSSDWLLKHDLSRVPSVAVERDVNGVSGRASMQSLPSRKAGAQSVTIESRDIRTFGRG